MRVSCTFVLLFLLVSVTVSCASPTIESQPSPRSLGVASFFVADLLPQGTAIGDVSSDHALLWLRTEGPAIVTVEWGPAPPGQQVVGTTTAAVSVFKTVLRTTTGETDYTLTVPLEKLRPATRYRYQIWFEPVDSTKKPGQAQLAARGEFTSLPDLNTSAAVTFAWSGDLGGQSRCRQGAGGYPIFGVIQRQKPDFFLFLGDTIYGDSPCSAPPSEPGANFTATTLSQYRDRHRYQREAELLRGFLRTVPVYVIWDDHEVRNNFSGPFDELMPAGRQALREYWPITSPVEDPHRLYRRVRYGADLDMFILDTRQYRSSNSDLDGPAKTMLGAAQLAWLLEGLRTSTATWKVIVTSVPLSIPKGGDKRISGNDGWASGPDGTGFERERLVIVDTILHDRIKNIVFLAGDVHWAQAAAYDPNQDGVVDFHEYIAGPLSAYPGKLIPMDESLHPTRLFSETGVFNFGLVRVTADAFEVTTIDETGKQLFSHRIPVQ